MLWISRFLKILLILVIAGGVRADLPGVKKTSVNWFYISFK